MQRSDNPNEQGRSGGCGFSRVLVLLPAGGAAILFALFAGVGSATSTPNVSHRLPVTIKPPARVPVNHNFNVPVIWSWNCTASSAPPPWVVTLRWEVAPAWNGGPVSAGSPPFTFSKHSQAFTLKVGNACDNSQRAAVLKRLSKDVKLLVQIGGDVQAGGGGLAITQEGGFRNHDPKLGPIGEAQAFHLGVTITQGKRTLLDTKICSYSQTGFDLAEKGVLCWG
jgi:hypothetical protein